MRLPTAQEKANTVFSDSQVTKASWLARVPGMAVAVRSARVYRCPVASVLDACLSDPHLGTTLGFL